jgi:hypothetical protein
MDSLFFDVKYPDNEFWFFRGMLYDLVILKAYKYGYSTGSYSSSQTPIACVASGNTIT